MKNIVAVFGAIIFCAPFLFVPWPVQLLAMIILLYNALFAQAEKPCFTPEILFHGVAALLLGVMGFVGLLQIWV